MNEHSEVGEMHQWFAHESLFERMGMCRLARPGREHLDSWLCLVKIVLGVLH